MSDILHHIKLPGDDEFREIIDQRARQEIEEEAERANGAEEQIVSSLSSAIEEEAQRAQDEEAALKTSVNDLKNSTNASIRQILIENITMNEDIAAKQDKLVAGENVTIDGNVISSKTEKVTRDTINAALGVDVVEAIENTERELDGKQDTLTAGDGIRIEDNVISAAGGSSTDVQINGTSIVTDGVADIPLASKDLLGVVSVGNEGGLTVTGRGALYVAQASVGNISARTNQYKPITSVTLNTAVTAALTDSNHIELSAEQQSVAQQVLGIYSAEGVTY